MVNPKAQKEAYLKWRVEGCPFVVNGRPGVAASMPSELTPSPGFVCDKEIWSTILLCDLWQALPKLQVSHCGSSTLAKDVGMSLKRPSLIH